MKHNRLKRTLVLPLSALVALPVTGTLPVHAEEAVQGIVSAKGITRVQMTAAEGCGNGIGTYPLRHINAFVLEYSGNVDASKLNKNAFKLTDQLYVSDETLN